MYRFILYEIYFFNGENDKHVRFMLIYKFEETRNKHTNIQAIINGNVSTA